MADAEWWMCHDVLVQVAGRLRDGRPLGILTGAGVSIESGVPSAGGVVALLERHGLVTDRGLAYQDAMASAFPTDHERGAFLRSMCSRKSAGAANQTIALLCRDFTVGPLLTTNFDHLLEQACVSLADRPIIVSMLGSPSAIAESSKSIQIIKLHGDLHFDVTAHSDQEMARHHAWLRDWSQLRFRPGSSLLVLGHSGLDAPIRELVRDLLDSGTLARVYWGVFKHESESNVGIVEALQQECGGPDAFVLFRHEGAAAILSQLYELAAGQPPLIETVLLPAFQVVTGLIHGAAEVDARALAGSAAQADVGRLKASIRDTQLRLVEVRADDHAERAFRALAALAAEQSESVVTLALDQADTLPNDESLIRALTGWVARTTGEVVEASRAQHSLAALAGLRARIVINLAQAFQHQSSAQALAVLATALPDDAAIWVVSDVHADSIPGFEPLTYSARALVLPSSAGGILEHIRRSVDRDALRRFLVAERQGRTVEDLIRSAICYERGNRVVIDRTRWTQTDYFPAGYLLDAIGVAEQLARTTNSFEALNWSSDLESLNFSAASEYPLRRNLYTSAALKWLLGAATSWSGTRGTGYFLTTLKEILHASTGTIVGQLDALAIGQVRRVLAHWPPPPVDWLGQPTLYVGQSQALDQLASQIDRQLMGDPSLAMHSDDDDLRTHMRTLEAIAPGMAYQFVGWAVSGEERVQDYARFFDLLNMAGDVAQTVAPTAAVMLDDAAWMLFAVGDHDEAFRLWELVTDQILGIGGIPAVIHLCNYGVACYLTGEEQAAANMLFESALLASRIGDEGRVWRALAYLAKMAPGDAKAEAWIDSWLEQVAEDLPNEDRVSQVEFVMAIRGVIMELQEFPIQ
jgi:hypothetical protein